MSLCIMSGFWKAKRTVLTVAHSNRGSERARGLLQDTRHSCQCSAGAGAQASSFLIVRLFCLVIIGETVFPCRLSLGTSPGPHSPLKKAPCCSLNSLAAFHLFQVLMALPIMQFSKQMLGDLSWPCAISEEFKKWWFLSSSPECKFSF